MSFIVSISEKGKLIVENEPVKFFPHHAKITLPDGTRFLYDEQVMELHEATTPIRRLYLAIQFACVGYPEQLTAEQAVEFGNGYTPSTAKNRESMAYVKECLNKGDLWASLEHVRKIMKRERQENRFALKGAASSLFTPLPGSSFMRIPIMSGPPPIIHMDVVSVSFGPM